MKRIRIAQSAGPVCTSISSLPSIPDFTDPRGVAIRVTRTVDPCPTGAGTVRVTVTAVRTDTAATLATAATLVLVK